jgi:large subunit ribosomal protein L13
MKTFSAKSEEVQRGWFLVDAKNKILGRLATEIARRLRGKHKPEYTPHVDTGDYIIVLNAGAVQVTGRKATGKVYYRHSGYPGGLKAEAFEKLIARRPEPKNSLGRAMLRKLKVYASEIHPHTAQQPEILEF